MERQHVWQVNKEIQNNYISAVKQAIEDDEYFLSFKKDARYNSVVGMGAEWQREKFEEIVKNKDLVNVMDSKLPSPTMRESSITSLRYMATAEDIYRSFDFGSVMEFGVGFGGLCHALQLLKKTPYTLVDLPEVVELAEKYLAQFDICLSQSDHDLFISEFCLSEFDDESIIQLYEKYIKQSKYVYLVMNIWDSHRKEKIIDMLKKDFHVDVGPELLKSEWDNWILRGKSRHE